MSAQDRKKLIECPYCSRSRFYNTWNDFKEHMKNCPDRFQSPDKRFKARIKRKQN